MREDSVVHIRLTSGQEIFGVYVVEVDDGHCIEYPMLIEANNTSSKSSIVLNKFLPFTEDQFVEFKNRHIVTMTSVEPDIAQYYYNSIRYNALYVDPSIKRAIREVNTVLKSVVSDEVFEFQKAMKDYDIDPEDFKGKPH